MRFFALVFMVALAVGACAPSDQDMTYANGSAETATPSPSMKSWMSANASPALKSANYEKLAYFFRTVPSFAPQDPRFASWKSIAASGADAVSKRDIEGVREACKSCHDTHRKAYRDLGLGR